MVHKFKSFEPELKLLIKDSDGDQVTVQFEPVHGKKFGLFQTEETKIAEGLLSDSRNGVEYMDEGFLARKAATEKLNAKPKKKPTASAPKTPKTSKKKRKTKK